ncbi:MAG TPA: hypothetical protein VHO25_09135 [Polyangiaceae bacterium]|nr:hypothetical protein [Polyangiaceae bacterium]
MHRGLQVSAQYQFCRFPEHFLGIREQSEQFDPLTRSDSVVDLR